MKKSLLALAVLGAFAGAASAQSSVTIYGKVDVSVGKPINTADKQVMENSSRIGFRGVEDLGGGMAALFGLEHRFAPDTGVDTSTSFGTRSTPINAFWNGFSTVGLRTTWGTVNLGRQYTPSFSLVQNQLDPFGGDTVASVRASQIGAATTGAGQYRYSDSIRYDFSAAGINFAAAIAEANQTGTINDGPDRPFSIAANYSAGPLFVGIGYEDNADADDRLLNLGARYAFGPATLSGGVASGKDVTGAKFRGFLVGLNWNLGAGDVKVGFAQTKVATAKTSKKFGLGYHHSLSKRTKLYADVARDTGTLVTTSKTGYDFGIQHNF